MSEQNENKLSTIFSWVFGILAFLGIGYGVLNHAQRIKEEEAKIEAQNVIARQSAVIEEREGLYSRLSQQQEDIIDSLKEENGELAELINQKDERILALSDVVANFEPVRVVVRRENVTQEPDEDDPERTRVEFDQIQDPIRVSGYTLTDPAEARVDVSYVRPMGITSVLTQREDGSWRAYFETDYSNVRIEQIDTQINPRVVTDRDSSFLDNIIIGGLVSLNSDLDGVTANAWGLYELGDVAFGPSVGASVSNDSFATFGVVVQGRPF